MSAILDRARTYLARLPGAISGAGGHTTTYAAAVAMVRGFGLSETDAYRLLVEVHNPLCAPPWTELELRRKVKSAAISNKVPMGYLLGSPQSNNMVSQREPPTARPVDVVACWTAWVAMLGDFTDEPDVYDYLDRRKLIIAAAPFRIAALPNAQKQRGIISILAHTYSSSTLVAAGIAKENGQPMWPDHRLVIPWRDSHGNITTVQRRRIDGDGDPRYVFPRGMSPTHPYGSELVDSAGPLAIVEGPIDAWAAKLLNRADNLSVVAIHSKTGWRPHWAKLAENREIYVGLDADADAESLQIANECYRAGATKVHRWHAPKKDWAACMEVAS